MTDKEKILKMEKDLAICRAVNKRKPFLYCSDSIHKKGAMEQCGKDRKTKLLSSALPIFLATFGVFSLSLFAPRLFLFGLLLICDIIDP